MTRRLDAGEAAAVMRAAALDPIVAYPGSTAPWPCVCARCERTVTPTYSHVRRGESAGCRYCSRRAVTPDDAVQAMRAAGLEPLVAYPGTEAPWPCRCMVCAREVTPTHHNVMAGQSGCRYCAGKAVTAKDAATTMRAAGLEPLEPFTSSQALWRCRCQRCRRVVTPRYANVQQGHSGCTYCTGHAVDNAFAVEVMRDAGLEPLGPFPGAVTKWPCICMSCGRQVQPKYNNIQQGGGGCRYCAHGGYWKDGPSTALVYLLVHQALRAYKVGVMREHTPRIDQHRRNGWAVIQTWPGLTPQAAYDAEQAAIALWRDSGAPDAVAAELMPQGGSSETAHIDLVDLALTRAAIERVITNSRATQKQHTVPQ